MKKLPKNLQEQISLAYNKTQGYKSKYKDFNKKIYNLSWADFRNLPYLTKRELSESKPYDFVTEGEENLAISVHTTSGTTGYPIYIYFTQNDWKQAAKVTGKAFLDLNLTDLDTVVQAFPNGFPLAGSMNEEGLKYNNCLTINIGVGESTYPHFIAALFDLHANVYMGTPSTLIINSEKARANGYDLNNTLQKAVFIGEPLKESHILQIIDYYPNITICTGLGQTEMHTIIVNCPNDVYSLHLDNKFLYHEFIKEDGTQAKEGEEGEHIITSTNFEAQPLIRYKTGDVVRVLSLKKCDKCGKACTRISLPTRRSDNLLKVKGILVDPFKLHSIVESICSDEYINHQFIVKSAKGLDCIDLIVLYKKTMSKTNQELITKKLKQAIKEIVGIRPNEIIFSNNQSLLVSGSYKIRNLLDSRTDG